MDAVMQQRGRQQVLMNEGQRLILHSVHCSSLLWPNRTQAVPIHNQETFVSSSSPLTRSRPVSVTAVQVPHGNFHPFDLFYFISQVLKAHATWKSSL